MNERDQQRKIRHRLAMLRHADELSGNVAATCRYYGPPTVLLHVEASMRRARRGRPARRLERTAALTEPDQGRGGRQDHVPAVELPLRPQKISMYLRR